MANLSQGLALDHLTKDTGWAPNIKQEPFLALPWSIKEAAYLGGAGSGKSDVLLYYPLVHKLHHAARFKQVFMRRTFPELRNEIVPRSRDIYRKFGATFNKSDMAWTFPRPDQFGSGMANDGAVIFLGHCENEDDVHKYDSMEINLYTPDEITSFTEWIYLYIAFTRVRTSDPSLPAIIRSAGMPGGIGHTWVKRRFVDPCPSGGKILVGRGGVKRIFIHATQADNPHVDPDYKASLQALPEAEKNAKLHGSFDAYLGQVFEEFRDRRYPDEPEEALHVIEPFDIPSYWPRIIIGDWGYSAMAYVASAAISPTGRAYIYRERHWRKVKIAEWSPFVRLDIETDRPKVVKFCRSAGQDQGRDNTIQEQLAEELGVPIELTANSPGSRIATKTLLHEFLRWKQKPILSKDKPEYSEYHAQWIFRNKGLDAYKQYLIQFQETEPETNLPKLQIFNTCPLLINALKSCVYAKSKDGIPAEDVAEFDGDDPYDVARYIVDTISRYVEEAQQEFKKIKEQQELEVLLASTGNYHLFYQKARILERNSATGHGVSRYGRRGR